MIRSARPPTVYPWLVAALGHWPFRLLVPGRAEPRPVNGARIGYFRTMYPGLTETFVRRELESLRQAGLDIQMFALTPSPNPCPPDPNSPGGPVHYLSDAERQAGQVLLRKLWRTRPWTVCRLYLFVMRHPYRVDKTWQRDRSLFDLAVQLAGALHARGITHLHAPFADRGATVCFIAARLLGAGHSVQARASELHRFAESAAALDRLRPADFIITNSKYNERFLRSHLDGRRSPPIHVIYNGLDLERFGSQGSSPQSSPGGPVRILSVGRLD